MSDSFDIGGRRLCSRLFIGTAGYPNRQIMLDSIEASEAEVVTAYFGENEQDDRSNLNRASGRI
jgi:thiazole synthase ThiGH ThiG subunit